MEFIDLKAQYQQLKSEVDMTERFQVHSPHSM